MTDRVSFDRRFLAIGLAGAAAAQAIAAIVFFFAANWWDMAPALKIGLIDGALAACGLAAVLAAPASFARAVWVVAGMVLTGVLFAVHGQIWQTGADAWELFALWTALAILWALAARMDAAWAVTAIVAVTAALLWLNQRAPEDLIPDMWVLPVAALAPLAVAALRRIALRLPGGNIGGRWLIPLLLAGAAVPLGMGGVFWLDHSVLPLLAGLLAAGLTMAVARPARCGPWPFAIALTLAVVLAESLLLHRLVEGVQGTVDVAVRLLLAAGLMLAGVAGLAFVLRRLFRGAGIGAPLRLDGLLSAAIGVGAWIAALVAAAGWGALMGELVDGDHAGTLVAVFAAAIAAALWRKAARTGGFAGHVQAAFLTIAYGALLFQMTVEWFDEDAGAVAAVLLLPLLLAVSANAAAGTVATLIAVTFAALRLYEAEPASLALFSLLLAVPGHAGLSWQRASVRASAVCLLLATFVVPGALEFADPGQAGAARAAAALAAAGLMAVTLYRRPDLRDPRLVGAGGLVLAGSLAVPAGGAGLVGLTAMSARAVGWPLVALGFASAAWAVVRFYYLLDIPLADKAGLLALGAGLTAAAWVLVGGLPRLTRPGLSPAAFLLLGCALLPAGVEAVDAHVKARVVAEGREVLLPLRPADPRSLIQGDYMALRYDPALTKEVPAQGGPVLLRLDGQGAARAMRLPDGGPQAADEVAVTLRPGRRGPKLAPDSFLFQEGTGEAWAKARFAIVRIDEGTLVLTGLADDAHRPIGP